jgi:hypothetical protein
MNDKLTIIPGTAIGTPETEPKLNPWRYILRQQADIKEKFALLLAYDKSLVRGVAENLAQVLPHQKPGATEILVPQPFPLHTLVPYLRLSLAPEHRILLSFLMDAQIEEALGERILITRCDLDSTSTCPPWKRQGRQSAVSLKQRSE